MSRKKDVDEIDFILFAMEHILLFQAIEQTLLDLDSVDGEKWYMPQDNSLSCQNLWPFQVDYLEARFVCLYCLFMTKTASKNVFFLFFIEDKLGKMLCREIKEAKYQSQALK